MLFTIYLMHKCLTYPHFLIEIYGEFGRPFCHGTTTNRYSRVNQQAVISRQSKVANKFTLLALHWVASDSVAFPVWPSIAIIQPETRGKKQ